MNANTIENILINTAFILLLFSFITEWTNLIIINNKNIEYITKIINIIINICLSTTLLARWINNHYFPISNLYESLIFLAWSITFINIILVSKTKNKIIGAINIPISLFIISFTSLVLPNDMKLSSPLVPALQSNWLMMHVTVMMISYSTLMIGSLLSIIFLIISNGKNINLQGNSNNYKHNFFLKYKTSYSNNIFEYNKFNLAPIHKYNTLNLLEIIDNLSYRIIGLGFPLLTVGIIAGSVWANEAWGSYWSWDPKETWALITWLIFAAYLHSRLNKSWQGKKPAILASLGFIIIWICYLGVNFLGKGLHSYGWIS